MPFSFPFFEDVTMIHWILLLSCPRCCFFFPQHLRNWKPEYMRRRDFWDSSLEKRYKEYKKDTTRPSLKVGLITKCFLHNSSLLPYILLPRSSFSTFQFHILREPLNLTLYHDRRYLSHIKSHDGSNTQKKNRIKQKTRCACTAAVITSRFLNFTRGPFLLLSSLQETFFGEFFHT